MKIKERLLKSKQKWDRHESIKYTMINDINGDVIYSYKIETYKDCDWSDELYLSEIYVDDKYRGLGYFNKIMDFIVGPCGNYRNQINIVIQKGSTIQKKYEEYGFILER